MERNKYVLPQSEHMPEFDFSSVANADLYLEQEGASETIGFDEALEYANKPLDEEVIKEYSEARSNLGMKDNRKTVSSQERLEEMKEDYFDHATSLTYHLELEDKNGEKYEFVGQPRTDLAEGDFNTLIFPSIIPFQAVSKLEEYDPNDNPHLVMREMVPYGREIEEMIVSDAEFTGEGSYDWEVSEALRSNGRNWVEEPDNFVYVDEIRDFLALNGEEGLYQEIEGTDIPEISSSDWKMLHAEDDKFVGLRPFYNEIWDTGLNVEDAEKLGQWRGVNRGIGRWVFDMDDEFFQGISGSDSIIGFYDNEMPFAVGSDKAFERDIRGIHNDRIKAASENEEFIENKLEPVMKEEEERMSGIVEEKDIDYMDFVPRKIDEGLIPEEMKI
jgi:hypothetical protein